MTSLLASKTNFVPALAKPRGAPQLLALALVMTIVGCSSSKPAPVLERNPASPSVSVTDVASATPSATASALKPNTAAVPALDNRPRDPNAKIYVVKPGDSLYAIAFQNGVEYRELAAWNNLENVNKIRVGQELRVNAPTMPAVSGAGTTINVPSVGGVAQLPLSATAPTPTPAPTPASGLVAAPLVSIPSPAVGVPGAASELQAAQNIQNSGALKVEPKISKQPYSDAAYNQALQQAGGAPNSSLSSNGVIIPNSHLQSRPATGGHAATAGAQPPLTGLPSQPPSTSTSTANAAPTKIAVAPIIAPPTPPAALPAALPPAATPIATPQPTPAASAAAEAAALSGTDMPAWIWPLATTAKPRITATFTDLNKGIDVSGTRGQGVLAAAPGKVVYSGTAMRGYGQLVIVKHNVAWFSAYAHNDKILVAEGDSVKKGQKIAEMGATDADSVKLHFEIRKQGVPIDPLKFLPPL